MISNMASNTKKTTVKKDRVATASAPKKVKQETGESRKDAFDARKLLAVPLLVLAAYCAYILVTNLSGFTQIFAAPYAILVFPPFPAIFVGAFSGLASYLLLKGWPIGRLATVVAWLFVAISLWIAFVWTVSSNPGSNPSKCAGLFGAMQNCADVTMFQTYVLFLNPFSLAFYSLLAIAGIGTMSVRLKR